MSTSLLVNKMKEVAASQGKNYDIHAHALTEEAKYAPTADVILIGPQVRFELENMRKRNPGKKITDIKGATEDGLYVYTNLKAFTGSQDLDN